MKRLTAVAISLVMLLFCLSGCAEKAGADRKMEEDLSAGAVETVAEPVKAQVINVLEYSGTATVTSGGAEMAAYNGMRLSAGDRLKTGDDSHAILDLNNGGTVVVEKESELEITQSTEDYIEIELLSGNIINNIEKGQGKYAVKANNVTMGVLGTIFKVELSGGTAKIDLYEGKVNVTFVGSDGSESSFDLGQGLSFRGTDEAMESSREKGRLETEEFDYPELTDEELDWITGMLSGRAGSTENPDMLDELIGELEDEIERRKPRPVLPAPTPPPAAVPPASPEPPEPEDPEFGDVTGALSMSPGGTKPDALTVTWTVAEETKPFVFGYRWSAKELNPEFDPSNSDWFIYDGNSYAVGTGTSVIGYYLSDYWGSPDSPSPSPLTLYAVMVGTDLANVTAYDAASVTVQDKTPSLTYAGNDAVIVMPTTSDVSCYSTSDGAVQIDVTHTTATVADAEAGELISEEAELYPDGETSGKVVTTEAQTPLDGSGPAADANLDVYQPAVMTTQAQ